MKADKCIQLLIYLLIVTVITYTAIDFHWLKPLELKAYDLLFHLKPEEPIDDRIYIIGINDTDIDRFGTPVPDTNLAELIEKIQGYNPRIIGLDIHRNMPTVQGFTKLSRVLEKYNNIVGIEKTNHGLFDSPAISPNKILKEKGMSSASDLIKDYGYQVRRAYLYIELPNSDKSLPSFGLKVALEYLKKDQVFPSGQKYMKLGKANFHILTKNRFFYELDELDSFQSMINYRSSWNSFYTISLSEIYAQKFDPSIFKDKVILIGSIASSLGDNFYSPLSKEIVNINDEVYGVEIHANIISHVISSALGEKKVINFIPPALGNLWIAMWLIFPIYFIVSKVKSTMDFTYVYITYILIFVTIIITIFFSGYLSLVFFGYWLPIATPIFGLGATFLLGLRHIEIEKNRKLLELKILMHENLSSHLAHGIKNYLNGISFANSNSLIKLKELAQFIEEHDYLYEDMKNTDSTYPPNIIQSIIDSILKAEKGINKVSATVRNILSSSLSNTKPENKVNINSIIHSIIENKLWNNSYFTENNQINIELNLDSNLPDIAIFPEDLESIFMNFIVNANHSLQKKSLSKIDFIPCLTISTKCNLSEIEITFRDNGEGIENNDINKIFDPFWTTKRSVDGVGIGLYLTVKIVNKYNGKLAVKSEVNEWTEFSIIFPLNLPTR